MKYRRLLISNNYIKSFTSKKSNDLICRSCKYENKNYELLCGVCNKLRDNDFQSNNFFSVFQINQSYNIDHNLLSKNYKELQKLVHPDKYLLTDQEIHSEAEKCSSLISNAYNILRDDFERANYMLKLRKYKYIEEGNENVFDQEYLEILLEVQDEIQNAESKEHLATIKMKIVDKINDLKSKIGDNFETNRLDDVYELLKLKKFYLSLLSLADRKEI